jgi:hypoxanthine phosphoribosyltransferase
LTIERAVERLGRKLSSDYEQKNLALVGILSGAAYFLVDLSRSLSVPHTVHFIQAASYHGTSQDERISVHGLSPKEIEVLKDRDIVVVDELYDNGKTLHSIVTYLKEDLGIPEERIRTCVALRKKKEVSYPSPDYCGVDDLPDVWYVGYGLDDNGTKRNLNSLFAIPKPPGFPVTEDEALFSNEEIYTRVYESFN